MSIKWPVMGSIYVVCVGLSIIDWEYNLDFGPITAMAWLVTIIGGLAFLCWAIYHIVTALSGLGSGA